MTDTKPDLSPQRIHEKIRLIENEDPETAMMLRALLDAKEAAERERDDWHRYHYTASNQLTEARASVAAAWEAGRDYAAKEAMKVIGALVSRIQSLTNPDPSATEALRRVKESCFAEGICKGSEYMRPLSNGHAYDILAIPNPYAAKEAAHD